MYPGVAAISEKILKDRQGTFQAAAVYHFEKAAVAEISAAKVDGTVKKGLQSESA